MPRKLGLTRARFTRLVDLLLLALDLQEAVLAMEATDGVEPMAERTLRTIVHVGTLGEQRRVFGGIVNGDQVQALVLEGPNGLV